MLKLQFTDQRQEHFWVVDKLYRIGSAAENHLVLDDDTVDPLHARLTASEHQFVLKDNNSRTGCFVNGQRITHKAIVPGDIIRIGGTELLVLDPRTSAAQPVPGTATEHWRLVADGHWLTGQSFMIPPEQTLTIGRSAECEICIPGTHLSRRHAELSVREQALHIRDLGSVNGTFLNEAPIADETLAQSGDQLRLDVYRFRILGPDTEGVQPPVRLPVKALSQPVERKLASTAPRRWKTRPTSPGNRTEPTYPEQSRSISPLWIGLALTLIVLMLGALFWLR